MKLNICSLCYVSKCNNFKPLAQYFNISYLAMLFRPQRYCQQISGVSHPNCPDLQYSDQCHHEESIHRQVRSSLYDENHFVIDLMFTAESAIFVKTILKPQISSTTRPRTCHLSKTITHIDG